MGGFDCKQREDRSERVPENFVTYWLIGVTAQNGDFENSGNGPSVDELTLTAAGLADLAKSHNKTVAATPQFLQDV